MMEDLGPIIAHRLLDLTFLGNARIGHEKLIPKYYYDGPCLVQAE